MNQQTGQEPADPPVTSEAPDALASMPSWEDARAAGVDFRGVGQEPGWIVDIYQDGRIKLIYDYGEANAEFSSSALSYPQEGATRYAVQSEGRSLVVTIRRLPCSDAMSGENYPSTVEAVIDGRTLNGCGRSV
jgi:uncharacterized membrane protein